VVIFYFSMVAAGIIVDLLFAATGLIPKGQRPPSAIEHAMIQWNYTTWLDIAAAAVAFGLLLLQQGNIAIDIAAEQLQFVRLNAEDVFHHHGDRLHQLDTAHWPRLRENTG
jgi:hypothetical protein